MLTWEISQAESRKPSDAYLPAGVDHLRNASRLLALSGLGGYADASLRRFTAEDEVDVLVSGNPPAGEDGAVSEKAPNDYDAGFGTIFFETVDEPRDRDER